MKTLCTTMICAALACVAVSPAQAGNKNCCPPPTACYQCQAGTTQASPQMAGCRFPLSYTDALARAEDATKAEAANNQLLAQLAELKSELAATNEKLDVAVASAKKSDAAAKNAQAVAAKAEASAQKNAAAAAASKAAADKALAQAAAAIDAEQAAKAQADAATKQAAAAVAQAKTAEQEAVKQKTLAEANAKKMADEAGNAAAATTAAQAELANLKTSLAGAQSELAAAKKTVAEQAAKLEAAAAVKNVSTEEKPAPADGDTPAPEPTDDAADKTAKTEENAEVQTES